MTAKKWGEPMWRCEKAYEGTVTTGPKDFARDLLCECTGDSDCKIKPYRAMECTGAPYDEENEEGCSCWHNDGDYDSVAVDEQGVRDCGADECPLWTTLPKARRAS